MPRSALLAIAAAGLLHLYTFAFKGEGGWSLFAIGLLAYSLTPYAVAAILARCKFAWQSVFGFATGALLGDVFMHYSVFIAPGSSTAALGLLFMPIWNLLLLGPVGALVGWASARIFSKHSGEDLAGP